VKEMSKINLSQQGIKNTKQRKCVLEVLEEANSPIDAMEILNRVNEKGVKMWISTIYRILEIFTEKGIVIKNTFFGEEKATYELNKHKHTHYARCLSCKKILEIDLCPIESFIPTVKDEKFYITGHRLEMYGYCDKCNKKRG